METREDYQNRKLIEREISNHVKLLNKEHRNSVLIWLRVNHIKVSKCGDGSRVNLSILEYSMLTELHQLTSALMIVKGILSMSL